MRLFWIMPLLLLANICVASEVGDFGVEVDVSTVGLFPPKLESVVVAVVHPESSAAEAGVLPGDKIVSIDGCKIPGCSAWTAKKKMKKNRGESAEFELVVSSGETRKITLIAQ